MYRVQVDSCLPEYTGKAKSSMSEHECRPVAPGKLLLQVQIQIKKSSFTIWLHMMNKANVFDKTLVLLIMSLIIELYHLGQKCHCLCTGKSPQNVNTGLCS